MPKFSIVFASLNPEGEASAWLRSQESEQVEVIIGQLVDDVSHIAVLNQALRAASGEYIVLVDETLSLKIPHWLELMQAHIESAPYQMLGLSGFEQIGGQESLAEPVVKVSTQVASVNSPGYSAFSNKRFFGDTHIKEVVMIDGQCIFARREVFESFPINEVPGYSGNLIAESLLHYQAYMAVECGQSQGVLLGVPYSIGEESPWQNIDLLGDEWIESFQHLLPLDSLQLSIWRCNLKGLDSFDSQALTQLLYLSAKEGLYRFQYRDHNRVSAVKGDQIALVVDHFNEVESLPQGDTFIICGAGTGLLIQHLLDQQDNEVLVVEPEFGLITELLKFYDWSDALSEGRLRFFPLVSGTSDNDEITLNQTTRLLQIVLDKNQRVSHVIRGYSYHLSAPWFRRLEQGLLQYLEQRKSTNEWVNKRKTVYDVTVVSPKCEIFTNLAQCFNDLGVRTRLFNVPDKQDQLSVDQIRQLLMQLSVDGSRLTVCRNRSFFETENVRKAASLERFIGGNLVNWWWDVPNVASFIDFNDPNCQSKNLGFAVDMLEQLPSGSNWLPPAASVKFCRERKPDTPWLFDVSFVGQSRVPHIRKHLESIIAFLTNRCGELPNDVVSRLLSFDSFQSLYVDLSCLETDIVSMLDSLAVVAPAHVYYYKYIFQMAKTAAFRVAAIEVLFAHRIPVAVFGDDCWVKEGIVPEEHFHGLIAPDDLPMLYQGTKVNLNLNFMQVSSTVNPKVLDILATDSLVVTDFRPEVNVLFPDAGFRPICFDSLDNLVPAVEKGLQISHLNVWRQLGNVIRSKHTLKHRAQWFIDNYLGQ